MEDAKLIMENEYGVELRHATRKAQTWPGYHESLPLGKAGYWVGTDRNHLYLGRYLPTPDELEFYGIEYSEEVS